MEQINDNTLNDFNDVLNKELTDGKFKTFEKSSNHLIFITLRYILSIAYLKEGFHMSTTIQKWGNSQGIRIPKNVLRRMSWDTNQEIEIIPDIENGKLILTKVDHQNHYLEKLFEDFEGNYQTEEFDWGEPQGDEVW